MKKMMKNQAGLSMWGWLVVLVMVGYIGMQAFALFTPFFNYQTVNSILDDVAADRNMLTQKPNAIAGSIKKKADFNNVSNFDIKDKEQFEIVKKKYGYDIIVNYRQEAPLFGPLSMLLTLNRTVELKK